jgi:hypothetical protein
VGHFGGVIRNNFVAVSDPRVFASPSGFDTGIGLESACGARVLHNTVASTSAPYSSIEWRFPATQAVIKNNLVSAVLRERDGGSAELAGNLENAPLSYFVDAVNGNLHLVAGATGAIHRGVPLAPGQADDDIDGLGRAATPDIGAHEFRVVVSSQSGQYHALAPARILDTRDGTGGVPAAPLGPGAALTAQVAGRGGVPASGATAVVINVTVAGTTDPSYLTVYPAGVGRPLASNLNWIPRQVVPNLVEVALGSNGQVTVFNFQGSADVIFDVAG